MELAREMNKRCKSTKAILLEALRKEKLGQDYNKQCKFKNVMVSSGITVRSWKVKIVVVVSCNMASLCEVDGFVVTLDDCM